MWMYGLPVPSNASIAASTTAVSRSALVASPGLARWMAAVRAAQHVHDGRAVVEVDDDRCGAARRGDVGLLLTADERGHLVAVVTQFGQDMRSDEPGCAGECDVHEETSA